MTQNTTTAKHCAERVSKAPKALWLLSFTHPHLFYRLKAFINKPFRGILLSRFFAFFSVFGSAYSWFGSSPFVKKHPHFWLKYAQKYNCMNGSYNCICHFLNCRRSSYNCICHFLNCMRGSYNRICSFTNRIGHAYNRIEPSTNRMHVLYGCKPIHYDCKPFVYDCKGSIYHRIWACFYPILIYINVIQHNNDFLT